MQDVVCDLNVAGVLDFEERLPGRRLHRVSRELDVAAAQM